MDVFTKNQKEEKSDNVEQIRGSIVGVILKLIVILLLFEIIFELLFYFLSVQFAIPEEWHHHISIGLLIVSFLKVLIEVYFITTVFLSWSSNVWYLTGKHIIKRTGILQTQEDVYHFDNIRSISVQQSLWGKLFRYGDITIKTSASGGYQGDVVLFQVDNPYKYETILKTLF